MKELWICFLLSERRSPLVWQAEALRPLCIPESMKKERVDPAIPAPAVKVPGTPIDKGLLKRRKIPEVMEDQPIAGDVSEGLQVHPHCIEALLHGKYSSLHMRFRLWPIDWRGSPVRSCGRKTLHLTRISDQMSQGLSWSPTHSFCCPVAPISKSPCTNLLTFS